MELQLSTSRFELNIYFDYDEFVVCTIEKLQKDYDYIIIYIIYLKFSKLAILLKIFLKILLVIFILINYLKIAFSRQKRKSNF